MDPKKKPWEDHKAANSAATLNCFLKNCDIVNNCSNHKTKRQGAQKETKRDAKRQHFSLTFAAAAAANAAAAAVAAAATAPVAGWVAAFTFHA